VTINLCLEPPRDHQGIEPGSQRGQRVGYIHSPTDLSFIQLTMFIYLQCLLFCKEKTKKSAFRKHRGWLYRSEAVTDAMEVLSDKVEKQQIKYGC